MKPAEVRSSTPALAEGAYLNFGASGPSPQPVLDATADCIRYHETDAPHNEGAYPCAFDWFDSTRERVADFVGADTDEVALTSSTADGIASVAASIDWNPGDVVVRTDLEHPAGVLPWWNLERRGVEHRVLDTADGHVDLDALDDAVSDARLLCLNTITWNYGTRLPVDAIVEVAHDHDCFVLVDAVQSFGQMPVDVHDWGADVVVGAGHKWLLGVWGAGVLWIDGSLANDLEPATVGYRSVEDASAPDPAFKPGAPRFEVGTTSPGPYAGLQEAIDIAEAVGFDTIEAEIERLTDRLKDGLGDRLISPRAYESGLVTFGADDPEGLVEQLGDRAVVVRHLPYPEGAVRASVHAYNTEADVDALLDALGEIDG